ncbi:hypothetical protein N7495_006327 [Penicillium taxi]|uniref:uncharacterized protein n=1 Tax=Penicillium taxi TaxID=168475 RepID=UPI002545AAAF|nr:uncharacterized protein N7495_006327 [Penicillium taxi]KAJ5894636.1 hypothetical protein N7495_006327 [Penicillium taxi]
MENHGKAFWKNDENDKDDKDDNARDLIIAFDLPEPETVPGIYWWISLNDEKGTSLCVGDESTLGGDHGRCLQI